jgi:hypothetical protein
MAIIYNFRVFTTIDLLAIPSGQFENPLAGYTGWLKIENSTDNSIEVSVRADFLSNTKTIFPGMYGYLFIDPLDNAVQIYYRVTFDYAGYYTLYNVWYTGIPNIEAVSFTSFDSGTPPSSTEDGPIMQKFQSLIQNNYIYNKERDYLTQLTNTSVLEFNATVNNNLIAFAYRSAWPGGFITSAAMKMNTRNGKPDSNNFIFLLYDDAFNLIWRSDSNPSAPNPLVVQGTNVVAQGTWVEMSVGLFVPMQQGPLYFGFWRPQAESYEFTRYTLGTTNGFYMATRPNPPLDLSWPGGALQTGCVEFIIRYIQKWTFAFTFPQANVT